MKRVFVVRTIVCITVNQTFSVPLKILFFLREVFPSGIIKLLHSTPGTGKWQGLFPGPQFVSHSNARMYSHREAATSYPFCCKSQHLAILHRISSHIGDQSGTVASQCLGTRELSSTSNVLTSASRNSPTKCLYRCLGSWQSFPSCCFDLTAASSFALHVFATGNCKFTKEIRGPNRKQRVC